MPKVISLKQWAYTQALEKQMLGIPLDRIDLFYLHGVEGRDGDIALGYIKPQVLQFKRIKRRDSLSKLTLGDEL